MAADGYRQRLALLDNDDRALAAGHGGLDQISGLHDEMLLRRRDHNGGLLRALRLVKRIFGGAGVDGSEGISGYRNGTDREAKTCVHF
jgi:hypothetical protein